MEYNNCGPVDTDLGPLSVIFSWDVQTPLVFIKKKKPFCTTNGIFLFKNIISYSSIVLSIKCHCVTVFNFAENH